MSGSANIIYQQDSSSRIEIYGSDNIVELLETKVNGETLNIKFKKNVNIIDKGKLEIKVFSPDLNRLTLNGSGGILFANGIHTKGDLKVTINGSGNIKAADLEATDVYAGISGSGNISCFVNGKLGGHVSGSGNVAYKGNPQAIDFPHKKLRKLD